MSEPKKVAIVGSRDFKELLRVVAFVRTLTPGTVVVSGGAMGVDRVAEAEARSRGLPVVVVLPDWDKHGRAAGPLRNVEIIAQADEVRAFWDGKSRGTLSSIDLAIKTQKPLTIVYPGGRCEFHDPRMRVSK